MANMGHGMRFKALLFVLFVPMLSVCANGATIVKFGATLCGPGEQLSNNECVEIQRGRCPAGYYTTIIQPATYSSLTLKNQCMNAYNKTTMPDGLYPIYNGVLVNFGATLCGPDEQLANNECVAKEQKRCPDGFYKTTVGASTFSSPSAELDQCMNSYNQFDYPEYINLVYNGVLVNFGATLCGAGKYLSDGACVARERGECPSDFYQVPIGDDTLTPTDMGTCGSGYTSYAMSTNCAGGESDNGLCAILCDGNLRYTGLGTCTPACAYGNGMLRISNGASYPMYAEKLTTQSLTVRTPDDDMCYINAFPGRGTNTINIKNANGEIYHVTD